MMPDLLIADFLCVQCTGIDMPASSLRTDWSTSEHLLHFHICHIFLFLQQASISITQKPEIILQRMLVNLLPVVANECRHQ